MCKELEDLIELVEETKAKEVAIALDRRGMHLDEIAEITGAKAATVRIWLDKDLNPIKE